MVSAQKNIYFCFIDYAKAFDYADHNKLKNLKRQESQTTLPVSWKICTRVEKQQLELDMEQLAGSKWSMTCILSPCLFNLYEKECMYMYNWITVVEQKLIKHCKSMILKFLKKQEKKSQGCQ